MESGTGHPLQCERSGRPSPVVICVRRDDLIIHYDQHLTFLAQDSAQAVASPTVCFPPLALRAQSLLEIARYKYEAEHTRCREN